MHMCGLLLGHRADSGSRLPEPQSMEAALHVAGNRHV
jgi:hypothetical protein